VALTPLAWARDLVLTHGRGRLDAPEALLAGEAGTTVTPD
jgi:hypothetical protein